MDAMVLPLERKNIRLRNGWTFMQENVVSPYIKKLVLRLTVTGKSNISSNT